MFSLRFKDFSTFVRTAVFRFYRIIIANHDRKHTWCFRNQKNQMYFHLKQKHYNPHYNNTIITAFERVFIDACYSSTVLQ